MVAIVLLVTIVFSSAPNEVRAEKGNVYINPFSATVVTYKTGDNKTTYLGTVNIVGCTKKSEIKNLKSSNKNMKVKSGDGYIVVYYGDKAQKTTITCTVKGVKLRTTFAVKKYDNPVKNMKIGSTNLTSEFKNTDCYKKNGRIYKDKKLTVQVKSGWKIDCVSVYNGGKSKIYKVNSTKFSKKITLTSKNSYISVRCVNFRTKVVEKLVFAY